MPRLRPNEAVLGEIPSSLKKVLPAGPILIKPGERGRLIVVVPFDPARREKGVRNLFD
jgi:hypothetical protein